MAAFLHDPKLVFLDEPTIGLDIFNKDIITNFLKKMKSNTGCTLIFTSHDLEEMSKICDSAIVLSEGKILMKERIEALLALSNQRKRIIFSFEVERPNIMLDIPTDKIKMEPYKMICEGIDKHEVGALISKVASQYYVSDMRIEESNFTDIIKSHLRGINE